MKQKHTKTIVNIFRWNKKLHAFNSNSIENIKILTKERNLITILAYEYINIIKDFFLIFENRQNNSIFGI